MENPLNPNPFDSYSDVIYGERLAYGADKLKPGVLFSRIISGIIIYHI